MEKITLTRISDTDKKKDGTILENKYGKYYRVGLQTEEYGDVWLNGFSGQPVDWKEGDVMEVEVTREEFNGTEQLKFKLPNKNSQTEERLKKLEDHCFGADSKEAVIDVDKDETDDTKDQPF